MCWVSNHIRDMKNRAVWDPKRIGNVSLQVQQSTVGTWLAMLCGMSTFIENSMMRNLAGVGHEVWEQCEKTFIHLCSRDNLNFKCLDGWHGVNSSFLLFTTPTFITFTKTSHGKYMESTQDWKDMGCWTFWQDCLWWDPLCTLHSETKKHSLPWNDNDNRIRQNEPHSECIM